MLRNIYTTFSKSNRFRLLTTGLAFSTVIACGQSPEISSSRTNSKNGARSSDGQEGFLLLTKISEKLDGMPSANLTKLTVLSTIMDLSAPKISAYLENTNTPPETGFCLIVPLSGNANSVNNPAFEVSQTGASIHLKNEVQSGVSCGQAISNKLSESDKKAVGMDGLDFLISFIPKI